jgi:predicted dithiol-disulfide oxidoreductase (DUF899 family)
MTAKPEIVSSEDWQQTRDDLLKAEKEATRTLRVRHPDGTQEPARPVR